jgi:hypothetical protein
MAVNEFVGAYAQTISSTSQSMQDLGFTTAQLGFAKVAHITVETAAIRYRYDGVKPLAGEGVPLAADGERTIEGTANIKNLNFIAQSSDATINVVLSA